jgi:hypothetical protein
MSYDAFFDDDSNLNLNNFEFLFNSNLNSNNNNNHQLNNQENLGIVNGNGGASLNYEIFYEQNYSNSPFVNTFDNLRQNLNQENIYLGKKW